MNHYFKILFTLFGLLLSTNSFGDLSGPKSIPGDYSTIALAVADLNAQGVGTGGVIFNVAAGHTETVSNLVVNIVANLPTSSNTVVFRKSGAGANPLITAAPGSSATADGIIKISGTDYITFEAIDLVDPSSNTGNAMMEWGYALMRETTRNGTQHAIIKNCTVTLQKMNTASIGIYIANRDTSGNIIVPEDAEGQNSYNTIYGNTVTNVYKGIVAISASTTRDLDNRIGVEGETANSITDWGGSTVSAEGIRCEGQTNVKIVNNVVNGGTNTSGSAATVGIIATLFGSLPSAANYEIAYNTVTITASSSSQAHYGIRALANGDTVRIHHNTVENCNSGQTSNAFYGISHDPVGTVNAAYIHNNIIRNNSHGGTGTTQLLYAAGSGTINNLLIRANLIYGNQKTGISGTLNGIIVSNASLECDSNQIYNNSIPSSSGSSSSSMNAYLSSGSPLLENVHNNLIYNQSVSGFGTSTSSIMTGIRSNSASSTVKRIYENTIYGLNTIIGTGTTGGAYGIYSTQGADVKIYRNKVYDIANTGANGTSGGIWTSSGVAISVYNNFVSNIKAPNSTNANAVVGINNTSTTANSTVKIYYNSVHLNASGGSSFGSSALSVTASATATSASLDLRNNVFINLSSPGSLSGQTVAYRRSSVNLQNFASESNHNVFYVGTAAFNKLIFADGVNGDQTIELYKARMSPRETNSRSFNVNFVNTVTGDLHVTGSSIGDLNLIGQPLAGITDDFDADTRSASHPYRGADESNAFAVATLNLTVNLEAYSPVQDTLRVQLRETSAPYAVVDTAKGYLSPTGTVSLQFAKALNSVSYYIVAKHRNSVETWSKSGGETFTAGLLNYDFTSSAGQAYGNNMVLVGGKYSFYTGEVNNDGFVDAGDISLIDNDAFNFVTGYVNTDLNGDSSVDGTDLAFADNNAFNFVGVVRP
ncbi:MAG: hypothetical protein K1X85_00015 [Ignavibacteria bacterium]|nr:hypothetical protein [Ignavibacteria bacterium]